MNRRAQIHLATLAATLLIVGCGSGNDPATPGPNRSSSIIVSPQPDSLNAGWAITGPESFSSNGTGGQVLNVYPGSYTVVWDSIPGWITPPSESVTLAPEVSTILHGLYNEIADDFLWVNFYVISPGVGPEFDIRVINTIPISDVLLFMDWVLVDTLKADSTLDIVVQEGFHEFDFILLNDEQKTVRSALNIQADMLWKIYLIDPFEAGN